MHLHEKSREVSIKARSPSASLPFKGQVTEQATVKWSITGIIVNIGEYLWSPANIKGENKDAKIYVGRSTTQHILLFCAHTLCMNYVTNTFLLLSSSVRSKQLLCFVQGQGQKREQKHTAKNFDEFHNHSPLLTMLASRVSPVEPRLYSASIRRFLFRL